MEVIKTYFFISCFLIVVSCNLLERNFFTSVKSKQILSSVFFWEIDDYPSIKKYKGTNLYKANINFPSYEYELYIGHNKDGYIFCDNNIESCELLFSTKSDVLIIDNHTVFTQKIVTDVKESIYVHKLAGGRSDGYPSNVSIWVISEQYGFIGYGYFDEYGCYFESYHGQEILTQKRLSELICDQLKI